MNKLIIKNISKKQQNRQIVNNVSFEINSGEIVGLLGPNGAGKTTTFRIIMGLYKPNSGSILLNDVNITNLAIHKRALLGIGYLPQESSSFHQLSVKDNISLALDNSPFSMQKRTDILNQVISDLNLDSIQNVKTGKLSGGQQRRVEIARTLALNPSILLLDEPFANVDPKTINEIKQLIKFLKSKNIGILITDHNTKEICSIADNINLLSNGLCSHFNSIHSLIKDKDAQQDYLGDNFVV